MRVAPPRSAQGLGINFDHWCFACGEKNPCGMRVDVGITADGVELRYTAKREHTGYEETLHGGVLATLLDEAMAWAVFLHLGTWGVTARLATTLRRPVAVGEGLVVTSRIARDRGRAVELRAEARRDGEVVAEGTGSYVKMPEAKVRELIAKYGEPKLIRATLTGEQR